MNRNFEGNSSETSSQGNKIFVGNVPFQCTTEEFQNCFKDMEGFVNADIIRRFNSKLSRGFGFVIFKDFESANTLLEKSVVLQNRELRFSPYSADNKQKIGKSIVGTNQIFIRNLDENATSENLKNHFQKYGDVNSCFVTSKNGRTYAVLSFNRQEALQTALDNEKEYQVYQYKKRRGKNQNQLRDPGTIYREGFRAGH
jgi:RNA recognition motif-containing protein